jgi:hypothetical protein
LLGHIKTINTTSSVCPPMKIQLVLPAGSLRGIFKKFLRSKNVRTEDTVFPYIELDLC